MGKIYQTEFILLVAFVALSFFTGISFAQSLHGHPASEIGPGTFIGTQSDVWVVPGDIQIPTGGLCVDDDGACASPGQGGLRVGAAGIYGSSSANNNLFLVPTSGSVVIGASSAPAGAGQLHVAGTITTSSNAECSLMPVFTGRTANKYDGNLGGYTGANRQCNTDFSGSHVCSNEEIMRTIRCNGQDVQTLGWISTGSSAPFSGSGPEVDDCRGWTSSQKNDYGTVWGQNNGDGFFRSQAFTCDLPFRFMCCKAPTV